MIPGVVLDSGPLGLVTQRRGKSPEADACRWWLEMLLRNGTRVYVPEITDYELRRDLLRAAKTQGLARLDMLKTTARYVPLTTSAMLLAADLWARARKGGQPTAAPDALDVDVILAAQTLSLTTSGLVVATTNPSHLVRYVPALLWGQINS